VVQAVIWIKRKDEAPKELKELMEIGICVLMSKTKLVKYDLKIYSKEIYVVETI